MATILLSSVGPDNIPLLARVMILAVLWFVFSGLGLVTGVVAGLLCARFSRHISPGWAAIAGLTVGFALGAVGGTCWILELLDVTTVFNFSFLQYILVGALASATLTTIMCLCWNVLRRRWQALTW